MLHQTLTHQQLQHAVPHKGQRQLDESGILAALVEKGVQENDTILIGDYQFDYIF